MQRDDDVEIPSLTLDQDEVSDRRPNAAPKDNSAPSPARPTHAPKTMVVQKKTSLVGVYFLLIFILLISAGVGYWLWQQNMQLRNEIYGAKSEIQNLDHQLIAADVSANKQGQTLEETLKTHDSEIRKLWAIAYDRNRKSIADNGDEIAKLQKLIASLKDTLSTQSKRIAIQSSAFNDLEAGYNKLIPAVSGIDEAVKVVAVKQEAQAKQLQSVESQIALQAGQSQTLGLNVRTLLQDLESAQKKISALENKSADVSAADLAKIQTSLTNHQDAINSSDAFRTQVNGEINRLRKQINQLVLEQQLNAE
ncbi:hypothetical protein MUS1_06920 [Marinomonas ushuaiensis DSM 15871]|uniref:Uncharacterized protein n=1 Tax=Marinomonas ushuaiensis DSM 15871 TaxID=1122207 RepID=X7E128_9GAMM|nr:hypothetical protein [Marinomonas ushuaiensis]ETX09560.1 hypothetical protein MUS1_06920 [Marinomonas ushuaiensis DSM 15871]